MTEGSFGGGPDDSPRRCRWMLFHAHFVAGRSHVDLAREQRDRQRLSVANPTDILLPQVGASIFGDINQIRVFRIDPVTLGLDVDPGTVFANHIFECSPVIPSAVDLKLFSQAPTREHQCAPCMFLFDATHQVGSVTDLSFDFFLAVAEIVVSDDRDDHTFVCPAGHLECIAVVVKFGLVFPAHPIAFLPISCLADVRKSDFSFGQARQLRCQDDAAGVTRPVFDIQAGIVDRNERIARISEDGFDKVQVADERTGREESHLHRLFGAVSGDSRSHDWSQHDRHPVMSLLCLIRSERQQHQILGRIHCCSE